MSDLLPGLREALLWKPNTPQLENAMTYAWEQALRAYVRELERAQINALNNSAAGEAQSASRQPSEPGGHGVAPMRSAPSGAPLNAGAAPATKAAASCRNDGRCQYAIDHGAEGIGHCPPGQCAWPEYECRYERERVAGATHEQAHHAASAPAATVPLSATEREVMRKARAAASRIVSRIAAAPSITDAQDTGPTKAQAGPGTTPASSVPLTEEQIEQVYEDARDYWLNDSEARGEMRELGIPPEADAVVKCDMKTLRALCDLALAGLRAKNKESKDG